MTCRSDAPSAKPAAPRSTYRELLRTPSVPWLLATSIVGRLNQGMTGLAVLLLTNEHSTYAVYSAVSVAGVAGAFTAGPLLSRWADAHGRRRILAATAALYACCMGALALVPQRPAFLVLFSLLAGLCSPPMTASVRAVLPSLVDPARRQSIFALESTVQELIFVVGPPTTSMFVAIGGPHLAVAACGVLALVGTLGYVSDSSVDAGIGVEPHAKGARVLRAPGIGRALTTGALLIAAFTGEVIGVVALVSGRHASGNAGFTIACGSLGSLVGGLFYGSRSRHRTQLRHLLLFCATGLAALLLAPNHLVLDLLLFCWGLTIAPTMSRLLERLSSLAPQGTATEVFGWLSSSLAVGNGLGSVLSGFLATAYGGCGPIVAGCGLTLLAALICEPWGSRRISNRP